MKRTLILSSLALILVIPGVASADNTRAKLERLDIFSTAVNTPGGKAGRAMGLMRAPAHVVYAILRDFSTYKEYMPRITGSYRSSKDQYVLKCRLPWPLKGTWANIKVRSGKRNGVYVITWKMNRGTLKQFEGTAWIKPYDKHRSLLTYQMSVAPNAPVPDALMARSLKNATWDIIAELRKRADKVLSGKVPLSSFKVAKQ